MAVTALDIMKRYAEAENAAVSKTWVSGRMDRGTTCMHASVSDKKIWASAQRYAASRVGVSRIKLQQREVENPEVLVARRISYARAESDGLSRKVIAFLANESIDTIGRQITEFKRAERREVKP